MVVRFGGLFWVEFPLLLFLGLGKALALLVGRCVAAFEGVRPECIGRVAHSRWQ